MVKLVAFGHEKRVGKDTAARFLCSHLRIAGKYRNVKVCGFADKLKDVCYQLYSWAGLKTREYYEDHQLEKDIVLPAIGKSPRQIWIELGTTVGRSIYEHTWIDYLFNHINAEVIIIQDMRFPNEADRIKALGGLVIKIVRPSIPHTSDIADDPLLNYEGWSQIIMNDSDLGSFNKKIISIAELL